MTHEEAKQASDEFEEWWGDKKDTSFQKENAWVAWMQSRNRILDPAGKEFPQQVAIDVLRGGNPGELGVLVDWMAENDRLDPQATERVKILRAALFAFVKKVEDEGRHLQLGHLDGPDGVARSVLGLPRSPHSRGVPALVSEVSLPVRDVNGNIIGHVETEYGWVEETP